MSRLFSPEVTNSESSKIFVIKNDVATNDQVTNDSPINSDSPFDFQFGKDFLAKLLILNVDKSLDTIFKTEEDRMSERLLKRVNQEDNEQLSILSPDALNRNA